jgi:hypothetical protein
VRAAGWASPFGSVRECVAVCGSVRQCAVVRQRALVRQCAQECVAVCGSAAVRAAMRACTRLFATVHTAVCGSTHNSVRDCVARGRVRLSGSVAVRHYLYGTVRHLAAVRAVRRCDSASDSLWQCERRCAAVRASVCDNSRVSVRLSGSVTMYSSVR